ncbi:uncharacterized protein LOC110717028 [Chenopodium quinoa]|uniref:uncharacterized protein LOC110717028 n=1 Tax=Chenopodium quinoa TaxID=63459 RepID=UPI000B76E825|nr:uncharacterized protein LOC110717028 [Chenopodium quinoa]
MLMRAQPTSGTVHSRPLRPQHYSVGINYVVAGFEYIRVPVPVEEDGITTLWETKGSFVQWPYDWVRLINEISKKSQTSKRRRVEQPKSIDQSVPKKRSEQRSESEKASKKNSSRGSAMQATPLVADTVLQSLSKDLTYLHNRVSMLPSDTPVQVALPKALFHYDTLLHFLSIATPKSVALGVKIRGIRPNATAMYRGICWRCSRSNATTYDT